ncbi:MAG: 3D domain-containing protein [Acidobacteria bacterium]|nr:3D domain-containing protein [Acidobacteriota bacterium]
MDLMVINLNKTVGIACTVCLSAALHFGANAQSQSSPIQSQIKSSSSDSQSNSDLDKVALENNAVSNAKTDAKIDLSKDTEIAEPKIKPKNPMPSFKVAARESKTDGRNFSMPSLENMGEPMTFHATAYALKGRTRSGTHVRRGVVAADPRVLPLGSVVQIKSGKYTGVYKVEDTGKVIRGNIVDVWVPDNKEARQFGRRKIQLHVLKLGTAKNRKR